MSDMSSVSVPFAPSHSFPTITNTSFEQCAKEIHKLIRSSLRQYGRVIEVFRELEYQETEVANKAKAETYRFNAHRVMQGVSGAFEALNLFIGLCPAAAKHTYAWLSDYLPFLSTEIFKSFQNKNNEFLYAKFGNYLSKYISIGDELVKKGIDIFDKNTEASRVEIEAQLQKSRELSDRRAKEAQERRSDSDEFLNLLKEINRENAEGIRAVARG